MSQSQLKNRMNKVNKQDHWITKKRLLNKSILFYINFIIVQWLFTRIAVEVSDDNVVGYRLLKLVLPITGWFGINYIYIFGK